MRLPSHDVHRVCIVMENMTLRPPGDHGKAARCEDPTIARDLDTGTVDEMDHCSVTTPPIFRRPSTRCLFESEINRLFRVTDASQTGKVLDEEPRSGPTGGANAEYVEKHAQPPLYCSLLLL